MCDATHESVVKPVAVVPADPDAFTGERIPLQPVQRVSITTLVDNSLDLLAADMGPAHRPPPGGFPRRPAKLLAEGSVPDGPLAEHGFSALVEVELVDGAVHRLLFDTGISPDGMVENMRRL
ncbi:MAG TPA: hypothetical protein VHH34_23965 [Pseudonocardiaceae bacterium]|nr:hypothetical protein [Pseudonocardiaceae bacterium]